ncbi:MAG: hypothetical protein LBV00_00835 [Propionibacteriaceae bacterium]|jgi:hypothetical protein|nr:hypothetical protein [Propionibacteriaceae bacterium]
MGHLERQGVPNPAKDALREKANSMAGDRSSAEEALTPVSSLLDTAWRGETPERLAFAGALAQCAKDATTVYDSAVDAVNGAYSREPGEIEQDVWVED